VSAFVLHELKGYARGDLGDGWIIPSPQKCEDTRVYYICFVYITKLPFSFVSRFQNHVHGGEEDEVIWGVVVEECHEGWSCFVEVVGSGVVGGYMHRYCNVVVF